MMLKNPIEKDIWAQEAAEAAGTYQPMVHKERVAFNFGVHMGVDVLKIKFHQQLHWMRDQLIKKQIKSTDFTAELKMIDLILEYHDRMGEGEVKVDT